MKLNYNRYKTTRDREKETDCDPFGVPYSAVMYELVW